MKYRPMLLLTCMVLAACATPVPAATPTLTATFIPVTETLIPSPTSTEKPTATEVPLPQEFLAQFNGTAYSFKDNKVFWSSPDGTKEVPIVSIEGGKFVFSVNGQEVAVDLKLATVPEAKWFLNGASDQIMAVNDDTGTYWKYEFNFQTNEWVEKSLMQEISTSINSPTNIEWNDIVGNRWATAVRQAIEAGKIPTFVDLTKV